ncbi:MAG: imidazole glycerol phosphate synthase subunit HisH [Cyclobacteriaceae bacterium]
MIAVIKYNAGNIRSVLNAMDRMGVEATLTDDPEQLQNANKVILPGVGEANTAMKYLKERGLDEVIRSLTQPFLGICLGMQLMCKYSEENDTECLGLVDEVVKKFPSGELKVPHMGWNNFVETKSPLFEGIGLEDDVYFVHSYYAEVGPDTIGTTNYIKDFSSAIQRDNFYGVQFHPEKSADVGQRILENFLKL